MARRNDLHPIGTPSVLAAELAYQQVRFLLRELEKEQGGKPGMPSRINLQDIRRMNKGG